MIAFVGMKIQNDAKASKEGKRVAAIVNSRKRMLPTRKGPLGWPRI
jgi:hypothetical protein